MDTKTITLNSTQLSFPYTLPQLQTIKFCRIQQTKTLVLHFWIEFNWKIQLPTAYKAKTSYRKYAIGTKYIFF